MDTPVRTRILHPQAPARSHATQGVSGAMPRVRPVGITGLGTARPEGVLTNAELSEFVDTSDAWIIERTGIRERRRAAPGVPASDLAADAARRALLDAGLSATDIDLIVVATATPDTPVPATACHVQRKIGATRAAGFDLSIGCSGFANALMTARALVACGTYENALVIGAEVLSAVTDYEDRQSCILFGDAAGAVVLQPQEDRGVILDSLAGMDGNGADAIEIPAGGSLRPASATTVADRQHFLRMDGRRVFKFAVQTIDESVRTLLARNDLEVGDLDLLVPHQANLRILEAAASRLELPMERVAVDIAHHGNTSSASIPLALESARAEGRLRSGDLVCLVGFGAGLSWAANLIRW
jgi:3-oxoacyl-[acyl-carrier-protein] synthase-3